MDQVATSDLARAAAVDAVPSPTNALPSTGASPRKGPYTNHLTSLVLRGAGAHVAGSLSALFGAGVLLPNLVLLDISCNGLRELPLLWHRCDGGTDAAAVAADGVDTAAFVATDPGGTVTFTHSDGTTTAAAPIRRLVAPRHNHGVSAATSSSAHGAPRAADRQHWAASMSGTLPSSPAAASEHRLLVPSLWSLDASSNDLRDVPHMAAYLPVLGVLSLQGNDQLPPDAVARGLLGLVCGDVYVPSTVATPVLVETMIAVLAINGRAMPVPSREQQLRAATYVARLRRRIRSEPLRVALLDAWAELCKSQRLEAAVACLARQHGALVALRATATELLPLPAHNGDGVDDDDDSVPSDGGHGTQSPQAPTYGTASSAALLAALAAPIDAAAAAVTGPALYVNSMRRISSATTRVPAAAWSAVWTLLVAVDDPPGAVAGTAPVAPEVAQVWAAVLRAAAPSEQPSAEALAMAAAADAFAGPIRAWPHYVTTHVVSRIVGSATATAHPSPTAVNAALVTFHAAVAAHPSVSVDPVGALSGRIAAALAAARAAADAAWAAHAAHDAAQAEFHQRTSLNRQLCARLRPLRAPPVSTEFVMPYIPPLRLPPFGIELPRRWNAVGDYVGDDGGGGPPPLPAGHLEYPHYNDFFPNQKFASTYAGTTGVRGGGHAATAPAACGGGGTALGLQDASVAREPTAVGGAMAGPRLVPRVGDAVRTAGDGPLGDRSFVLRAIVDGAQCAPLLGSAAASPQRALSRAGRDALPVAVLASDAGRCVAVSFGECAERHPDGYWICESSGIDVLGAAPATGGPDAAADHSRSTGSVAGQWGARGLGRGAASMASTASVSAQRHAPSAGALSGSGGSASKRSMTVLRYLASHLPRAGTPGLLGGSALVRRFLAMDDDATAAAAALRPATATGDSQRSATAGAAQSSAGPAVHPPHTRLAYDASQPWTASEETRVAAALPPDARYTAADLLGAAAAVAPAAVGPDGNAYRRALRALWVVGPAQRRRLVTLDDACAALASSVAAATQAAAPEQPAMVDVAPADDDDDGLLEDAEAVAAARSGSRPASLASTTSSAAAAAAIDGVRVVASVAADSASATTPSTVTSLLVTPVACAASLPGSRPPSGAGSRPPSGAGTRRSLLGSATAARRRGPLPGAPSATIGGPACTSLMAPAPLLPPRPATAAASPGGGQGAPKMPPFVAEAQEEMKRHRAAFATRARFRALLSEEDDVAAAALAEGAACSTTLRGLRQPLAAQGPPGAGQFFPVAVRHEVAAVLRRRPATAPAG